MSKTNPNKLEQHLLFDIDQASNIARSNDQIQSQSLLNYCNHFSFRVPVQAPPPKKASALLLLSSAKMLVDTYLYVDC